MNLSFLKYVKEGYKIADIGCGPNGAIWWDQVQGCTINAFDLYFKPPSFERGGNKISFEKTDVSNPNNLSEYHEKFDIVVCDHIFEHVTDPYGLALGCNKIVKKGGLLHIGIPDGDNFTDRFYRLIHSNGGGHIVKFNKKEFLELMKEHGFELIEEGIWADDWNWFSELFSTKETLENYGISSIKEDDIRYMADVFRKELTVEKGYWYGYEFLFKKIQNVDTSPMQHKDFATKVRQDIFENLSSSKLMEISDWASLLNTKLTQIRSSIGYRVLKKLKMIK